MAAEFPAQTDHLHIDRPLGHRIVLALDLIDGDTVSLSNLNRQIIALHSTVGRLKTDVMAERIRDIDPQIQLRLYPCFFTPENAGEFDFTQYDYIIDAVDMVTAKIQIAVQAQQAGTPVISSMGAGNKLGARSPLEEMTK